MRKNKKISKVLFITIIPALLLTACGKKKEAKTENTEKAPVTVGTVEVKPSYMEDYIEFGGSVSATDSIAILPGVAGKIASISVEVGDKVQKNQVIARVDPSKPGAEFALSPIKASAPGTVTAILPSVGAYVTTSSTVAEISSTDNLEIKINVSERYVPLISMNQIAEVTFKSFPNEKFSGQVIKISPVLDPVSRSMQVTLKLTDEKKLIKSGMFAHVKLTTEQKENILALPNRAILYNLGKPYVYQVLEKDGVTRAEKVEIESGLSVDGMTEITRGLSEGMKIVVKGQNMVSENQKVKAIAE